VELGCFEHQVEGKQVVFMNEAIGKAIIQQLSSLKDSILSSNRPGDISGLFACYILKNDQVLDIEWKVTCNKDWINSTFDSNNAHHIASLGFSISIESDNDATKSFINGFNILKEREPFKGSHTNFPFQCSTFLGIVLGVKSVADECWKSDALSWLKWVLDERLEKGGINEFQSLFYYYISYQLTDEKPRILDISAYSSLDEVSFFEYGLYLNVFETSAEKEILQKTRAKLVESLIKEDTSVFTAEKAALIFAAVNTSISKNVQNMLVSPSFVSAILIKFEDAMRRWRYDVSPKLKDPIKWPIKHEREVQDILWLILRSYFDDLIDEEKLKKLGHSSCNPDFAIPSLRLFIEVKYAYKKNDFKKIEKEIQQDVIGYLQNHPEYKKITVFIYDQSSSVQEHDITRRDLKKIDKIEDVIIVCKPSQLP
jgi:hypothetical protein